MFQARHHIDGFNLWILTVFRRANFDAQVTTGAIFRSHLQDIFLPAHITRFHIQRMQAGRGVFHRFRRHHFCANSGVWASGNAVVTLGTEFLFPDGDLFGDIAFFPASGAHRPGAVWRQRRNGEGITKPGEHRSGYGFHEIRGGIGNHWRSIGAVRIYRLQRNFFYGFTRQRQSLPVAFHQILAFATVTFGNRTLQFCEGAIARQNLRQMEKSHLHDGINTGRQATFAGDFRRVNHIEARFFLV